ncbi:hypothetical protein AB0K09_30865 [Streptomyces sp. NPDC049577]|uniref:hypothetical protein n=1 Tax=Streptomyces sp. NPDC049577 TaxID=3155153 RepID=UPI0034275064
MSGPALLTADEPEEAAPLLEPANALLDELVAFGRFCREDHAREAGTGTGDGAVHRQPVRVRRYLARREIPVCVVTLTLQETIGLRFADGVRLPYRHNSATWPAGQPLAGHTSVPPGQAPFGWLRTFFSHWAMIPDDGPAVEGEFHRLLRSALWICHTSGTRPAVEYLADLVESGQVVNSLSAAWAAHALLAADSRTGSPEELVASLMEGRLPREPRDWLVFYPSLGDSGPVALSREGRAAVESLVVRGWRLVDETRAAPTLDAWLSRLAALDGVLRFVRRTVTWSVAEVSLPLQAILSQFEELNADIAAAVFSIEAGESIGAGVPGFREHQQGVEQISRNSGDATGGRFRRERLLLPPSVYETVDEPPWPDWSEPGRHIEVPWRICHGRTEEPPPGPRAGRRRLFPGRRPRPASVREDPSRALALYPEDPRLWLTLHERLRSAGHHRSAGAARQLSERMARRAAAGG